MRGIIKAILFGLMRQKGEVGTKQYQASNSAMKSSPTTTVMSLPFLKLVIHILGYLKNITTKSLRFWSIRFQKLSARKVNTGACVEFQKNSALILHSTQVSR